MPTPIGNLNWDKVGVPYGPADGYEVRYIDYDGTVLSYQRVKHGGFPRVPATPSHDGLVFQGWNHSALLPVYGPRCVGALYTTSSGKTEATLFFSATTGKAPTLYLTRSDAGTIEVDWGDGSAVWTSAATGNINTGAHTYAAYGWYTIKIRMSDGAGTYSIGNGSATTSFIGGNSAAYRSTLHTLHVGANASAMAPHALNSFYNLRIVTVPRDSITPHTTGYQFASLYSVKAVIIPDTWTSIPASGLYGLRPSHNLSLGSGVTSLGSSALASAAYGMTFCPIPEQCVTFGSSCFTSCGSLPSISLPEGTTTVPASFASNDYCLVEMLLPSTITSIQSSAFTNDYSLAQLVCLALTPPTLAATSVFSGAQAVFRIYVPDASVVAYKAATNWSSFANQILPLSDLAGWSSIAFDSDGGTAVVTLTGREGTAPAQPTAPTKAGFTFGGWYKDVGLTQAWAWGSDVFAVANTTLYAKWS